MDRDRPSVTGGAKDDAVAAVSGWVLPAVLLLVGGGTYLLAHAWEHLLPAWAPASWSLVGGSLVVGVVAFTLAVAFTLHPANPPSWWRPLLGLLSLITGLGAALTAPAHIGLVTVAAAVVMILAVRTADTLGRQMAPALQLPRDYPEGDWSRQSTETRRIVLETWVVSAAAGAAAGGFTVAAALALTGASGLILAAGAHLDAARRAAARGGSVWEPGDRALVWRGAAVAACVAVAAASTVPGLPPLRSPGLYLVLLRPLQWLWRPTAARTHRTGPAYHGIHVSLPAVRLPSVLAGGGTAAGLPQFGALPARSIVVVVMALVAIWVLVGLARWRPELYPSMARLLRGFSLLAFLRSLLAWLRLRPNADAWRPHTARARDGGAARGGRGSGLLAALGDPRLGVRASYRRYLRASAAAGHARAAAESPAAFLRRMRPIVAAAAPEAEDLTAAYEQARYSSHPVPRAGVTRVREALARLLRLLRGPFPHR